MSPVTINRLKLLGIGAIAAAPVVGSYLLYIFWSPSSYTNYGTLLEPRRVPSVQMQLVGGTLFNIDTLRGRWIFVMFDGGRCSPQCEKKLWTIRQVRQAQGKDVPRMERVFFIEDDVAPSEAIRREYEGTWFVRGTAAAVTHAFSAGASNRDHIYLVDPQGNIMMRFPQNPDPKRMIKDISRLLKYSQLG